MPCELCDDTGWKAVTTDGVRRVVRCDCWRAGATSRLHDEARIPPRYRGCELEAFVTYPNDKLMAAVRRARRFADEFPAARRQKGLCLIGPPGIGKTHLAVAVLRRVILTRGARGLFYDTRDLLRVIRSTYNPLGAHRRDGHPSSGHGRRPARARRSRRGKDVRVGRGDDELSSTPVTTSAARRSSPRTTRTSRTTTRSGLRCKSRIGFRMHSRLHEMCEFLEYDGADYRRLPPNGGVDDLVTMWKVEAASRRTLPARAKGPGPRAAQAARPKELGWRAARPARALNEPEPRRPCSGSTSTSRSARPSATTAISIEVCSMPA